jgi:hypothetical protein
MEGNINATFVILNYGVEKAYKLSALERNRIL